MSVNFRLDGRAALITGAGTGMGRSMALAFAEAGASAVFLVGRRTAVLAETAAEIARVAPHCRAYSAPADVTSAVDRRRALDLVRKEVGRLDVLVHNAGLFEGPALADANDDVNRNVFAVNAEAPLAWTRDALPLLAMRGASVIGIASTLAVKPIPVAAAYNAAKAALVQLVRSLALELASREIRVNCILPAIVDTPMYRGRYGSDDKAYADGLKEAARLHPLGRVGRPEDVAAAALFLASPAAGWITGAALPVDGGMLVT